MKGPVKACLLTGIALFVGSPFVGMSVIIYKLMDSYRRVGTSPGRTPAVTAAEIADAFNGTMWCWGCGAGAVLILAALVMHLGRRKTT
jgi:hypothetical protein